MLLRAPVQVRPEHCPKATHNLTSFQPSFELIRHPPEVNSTFERRYATRIDVADSRRRQTTWTDLPSSRPIAHESAPFPSSQVGQKERRRCAQP